MKTNHNGECNRKRDDKSRETNIPLTTIRGIVIPADWDEKGNVVAIAISTYDEDEYFINIEKREKGKKLLALIREEVEVSGLVHENEDIKTITVKKYRLKKGFNQPVISELKLKES